MTPYHRGFTQCQVEHHMWIKFGTPILHAIDNFENYDIFFYIYIIIDISFVNYFKFLVIFIFVVIVLVQFGIILLRNGVFY